MAGRSARDGRVSSPGPLGRAGKRCAPGLDPAGAKAARRSTMESMTTKPDIAWVAWALIALSTAGCSGMARGVRTVDPSLYVEPPRNAVTFWGHACAYVDVNGFGI